MNGVYLLKLKIGCVAGVYVCEGGGLNIYYQT